MFAYRMKHTVKIKLSTTSNTRNRLIQMIMMHKSTCQKRLVNVFLEVQVVVNLIFLIALPKICTCPISAIDSQMPSKVNANLCKIPVGYSYLTVLLLVSNPNSCQDADH